MRLRFSLHTAPGAELPAHYNHPLSAAVYSLLRFGSEEFSTFLHDIGFRHGGHTYKLFTFALRFERMQFSGGAIRLLSPNADLYISSPLVDEFVHNVVLGTFGRQTIRIGSAQFAVERIETLPEPDFSDRMKFTMLSPLVLSTRREHRGALKQYYLRPEDTDDIDRVLSTNLARKYEILTGAPAPGGVHLRWDERYLARHERVTRRTTIEEDGRAIDIIGIQAPFELHGAPELLRVGYDCGFGEKNAMGFGMARAVEGR